MSFVVREILERERERERVYMKMFRALILIAVLLAACKWAVSDEIMFTDKLTRAGGKTAQLTVQCRGPAAQTEGTITSTYNTNITISLPNHQEEGKPEICSARFQWEGEYFRFILYSYPRDHQRCAKTCRLEARWDGLYGLDNATKGWDLIARYPIHPL